MIHRSDRVWINFSYGSDFLVFKVRIKNDFLDGLDIVFLGLHLVFLRFGF